MGQPLRKVRLSTLIDAMGFIGIESYDLIIYLALTMQALNASVLVIDNSDDGSFAECIPGLPETASCEPVDFHGITTVKDMYVLPDNYDYVIVYFGKNVTDLIGDLNEIYLVTDYQKHNVNFLKSIELFEGNYPLLLVRDRVASKVTPESIRLELEELEIPSESMVALEDSPTDLNLKVMCQYHSLTGMSKVSESVKEFLRLALSEDYEESAIKAAFKVASRRK